MTAERFNMLAEALEVDGALAKLTTLDFKCPISPGTISILIKALAGATSAFWVQVYAEKPGFRR